MIISWFAIAEGIILFFLGILAIIKIYKGSQIPFAYTMTAFTCGYGVIFVLLGI